MRVETRRKIMLLLLFLISSGCRWVFSLLLYNYIYLLRSVCTVITFGTKSKPAKKDCLNPNLGFLELFERKRLSFHLTLGRKKGHDQCRYLKGEFLPKWPPNCFSLLRGDLFVSMKDSHYPLLRNIFYSKTSSYLFKKHSGFPLLRTDKITWYFQVFKQIFRYFKIIFKVWFPICFKYKSANLSNFIWTKN